MSAAQPIDPRKAEIVRRHRTGESGAAIARAMGVSRQYVHALLKRVEAEGDAVGLRRGKRGRRKDRPLTAAQRAALCAHLAAGQETAGPRSDLTDDAVRAWFRDRFDRPLTVHQLRRVCTEEGLKLARPEDGGAMPAPAAPESPERPPGRSADSPPPRRRGRPRKEASPAPSERLEAEALEAMRRSNEEVAARLARERAAAAPAPARRPAARRRRNDPCPFDPNLKFKRCCGARGASWCLREADGEKPEA